LRCLGIPFEYFHDKIFIPFKLRKASKTNHPCGDSENCAAKRIFDLAKDSILSRYGVTCNGRDLYFFAGSVVRAALPAAAQELDRHGADYRFFRGAVVVLSVAALDLWSWSPWASVLSFAFAFYSGFEAIYLRWRTELATYRYLLFLHYAKDQSDAKK
jgi:hypothetical protein